MSYLIFSVGIVMGTGFGFMYCPAIVIVTMYFEKYRSLATGVTVCGAGVGTFVFSRIIGILIVNFDWRIVFIIYAGLVIIYFKLMLITILGLVLLCVPCGALYRPIEFEPIYEEDLAKKHEEEANENAENEQEKLLRKEKLNGVIGLIF